MAAKAARKSVKRAGPRRWVVVSMGLAVATAAAWALLSSGVPRSALQDEGTAVRAPAAPVQHGEIDERSREALREILREADDE